MVFLSESKTKDSLTLYLLKKHSNETVVVGLSTRDGVTTNKTYKNVSHICTSQEVADTILMLHAIDVASQNENAAIHILSTDTDVLILALAYFPRLRANPCMLIGHGKSRELIVLKPIYDVLGCPLVSALIGFDRL